MAALEHSVENPTVHGFQAITCVRKGTTNDDGHGVIDVRILHLGVEGVVQDRFS
jgi:hypothetical protein